MFRTNKKPAKPVTTSELQRAWFEVYSIARELAVQSHADRK